ncbi:acyltransferase [Alicyclobacillus dauci]|uniref:Acyltransferase n=1 Tax=Alicyclobacillus dauci TaxID=1475485 RepID=A0ABY6Z5A0_9BACL|nr:acyltransferase [Alicyclobacillus dauci]WAH37698.1 acyltransferase [Alicyclobacillus dauci]
MNRFDESAIISPYSRIETSVRGNVVEIHHGAVIDDFVKIKFAGGSGDIIIGEGSYINSGCVLYSGGGITIGKHVLIAANCTLAPVNHEYNDKTKLIKDQGFKKSCGGIVIEDDVWIGAGCVLLDGTHIERGCVIGAASFVKGYFSAYGVFGGNPPEKRGERS